MYDIDPDTFNFAPDPPPKWVRVLIGFGVLLVFVAFMSMVFTWLG